MPYLKRHKTAEIARVPRMMIAAGAASVLLVAAFLTLSASQPSARRALPAFSLPSPGVMTPAPAPAEVKPLRLVYRNSVVPGGVQSAAELAAVIARDPIAAAHYANFNVAAAHVVRVEQSRMVHVSYRIGNQIYWTKNKVRLALGENLLSDGQHLIRARCGNRIADDAQGPILLNEPAAEVLETAFVSADDLIDESVMAPLEGAPGQPALPNGVPMGAAAVATPAQTALLAHNFSFNPFVAGLTPLTGIAGSGAYLPAQSAPALLVDTVTVSDPAAAPAAAAPGASAGDPRDPVNPANPAPVGSAPAANAPADNGPADGAPAATPGDVKIDPPKPGDPDQPFIEPPVFTPGQPGLATPVNAGAGAKVPEPASAALVGLALSALLAARLLRRRRRRAQSPSARV